MTWLDLFDQIKTQINGAEDPETLMQVYAKLQYLSTEAHLRARDLEKKEQAKNERK